MQSVADARLAVAGGDGQKLGTLRVSLLANTPQDGTPPPLVVMADDEAAGGGLPRVQLLEGREYRFVFELSCTGVVTTDHPEVFDPDSGDDGRAGRLRPRLNTGTLHVGVMVAGDTVGHVSFEVRSRKVDYLTDYKTMLADLTSSFADAVMLRFAAGQHDFRLDEERDARTLYQRFAFLQSVLVGGSVDDALHQIRHRPYLRWEQVATARNPLLGVRGSSSLLRQLSRSGPKQAWPGARASAARPLPKSVEVASTTPTTDNLPNRFVRHALETWRRQVAMLRDILDAMPSPSSAILRGRAETRAMHDHLSGWLQVAPFRDAGLLGQLPAANQVLEKRPGYRDIYRAYFQAELAAALSWEGGEDVYGAGKRDVATLYEYWCYLQLVELLSELCDEPLDVGDLLALGPKGITVGLRSGATPALRGRVVRKGVGIRVTLWFNRTFERGASPDPYGDVSWSRRMRPDCSLKLEVEDPDHDVQMGSSWLHFDAKYRIEELDGLFGDSKVGGVGQGAKREDLLKMHAYRDAIRRSVGAYVLYPGDQDDDNPVYGELLPGLGAFRLRPGDVDLGGRAALASFLDAVLRHFADPHTERQRAQYWTMRTYGAQQAAGRRPAADTLVLLGYCRSDEHREWIGQQRRYNVRADLDRRGGVPLGSDVLSAEVVLLHGPNPRRDVEMWTTTGEVEVATGEELAALGYPNPGGKKYFVLRLGERVEHPVGLTAGGVAELRRTEFAPETVSLQDVLGLGRIGFGSGA